MSEKNKVIATTSEAHYYTKIETVNHTFYVDEPESVGGGDKAAHPTAYLLAALTSCTAITMQMYSERKGWDTGQIRVTASLKERTTDGQKERYIAKEIHFEKALPEKQVQRILAVGEKCPVSKLLSKGLTSSTDFQAKE